MITYIYFLIRNLIGLGGSTHLLSYAIMRETESIGVICSDNTDSSATL
jgi:hypothetical protein